MNYIEQRKDNLPNKSSLIRKLKKLDLSYEPAIVYGNDPSSLFGYKSKTVSQKLGEAIKYNKTSYIPHTYYELDLRK